MNLLQIDFDYSGPWDDEMTTAMGGLAQSITREPGFIWKVWTESREAGRAGGIYLFVDERSAQDYLAMHGERLARLGISDIRARVFEVNEALSEITGATLGSR